MLHTIFQSSFVNCHSLRNVELNEGLQVLGVSDFSDNNVRYLGVFENSAIEHVKFPSTLKKIEYSAFSGCKNLKSVDLPDALEVISNYAFSESGLERFVAPPSLRTIAQSAFHGCEQLKFAELNEGLETLGSSEYYNGNYLYYGVF